MNAEHTPTPANAALEVARLVVWLVDHGTPSDRELALTEHSPLVDAARDALQAAQ